MTRELKTIEAPMFQVDPLWPKPLPHHWVLGQIGGIAVDAQDHIWVLQRSVSLNKNERLLTLGLASCCAPAPPVLVFDQAGNLINHWGGPGDGYDWPESLHGITVDYQGNVWIGCDGLAEGNIPKAIALGLPHHERGTWDHMVLKFTQDGKFLMQIGKPGQSKGNDDVENLNGPADIFVDPKTNEAYIADGYVNNRVIVYNADTGKFIRMWGAYGCKPELSQEKYDPNALPPQQFNTPVHCVTLSNDNLVYVCARRDDRIQVFKTDGTFLKEVFIEKQTLGAGSAWDITFSVDPEQKYLYLADGSNQEVHILLRETLQVLTSFGDGGRQPGEFCGIHVIATDSKGNLYTGETFEGKRVQKFAYRGLAPVTKEHQGVVWPKSVIY